MRTLTLVSLTFLLGGCLTLYTQNNESLYLGISRSYEETLAYLDDLYRSCLTDECREEIDRRRAEADAKMQDALWAIERSRNSSDEDYSLNQERSEVQQALAMVQDERRRVMSAVDTVRDLLTVLGRLEEELRREQDWGQTDLDTLDTLVLGAFTFGIGPIAQGIVNGLLSVFGQETAHERLQRLRQELLVQLQYFTEQLVVETFNSIDRIWAFDRASEHVSFDEDRYGLTELNTLTYAMRDDVSAIPAIGSDLQEGELAESRSRQAAMLNWVNRIDRTYESMETDLQSRNQFLTQQGMSATDTARSMNELLSTILGEMDSLRDESRAAGAARESAIESGGDPDSAMMCPGVL